MKSLSKIRRLLNLLERLQSGRQHNSRELAELCGVSRRTVFRDLKTLQDSGVPVQYDPARYGYWVNATTYLRPTDLSMDETLSLILLAEELGGTENGIPFQATAQQASVKLLSNLPVHLREYTGELLSKFQIQTEPRAQLAAARQHYETLVAGLTEGRRVRAVYRSLFEQSRIKTLISPYRLHYQRRSWYVIGRSSLHRAIRTFHLGRFLETELTNDAYRIPPRFSLNRYFGNAWSMIRERGKRTRVVVRFRPLVASNVAEVAWHRTQHVTWQPDGSLDFQVTVDGINEISWWILGYGDQAEVLEPPELIELMRSRISSMAATYDKTSR